MVLKILSLSVIEEGLPTVFHITPMSGAVPVLTKRVS
jgi:hypothetical protein